MAADALSRLLPGLLAAAALIASAQAGAQQSVGEAPGADAVRQGCRSVVLVQCAQALRATPPAPADRRRALRQRLDARRLRQIQAQAGLSTIEITSERAATVPSDPWEDFRQSVATAPTPSCFSPDPMPQEQFEPQGLLRLPFLLHAAAVGKCR